MSFNIDTVPSTWLDSHWVAAEPKKMIEGIKKKKVQVHIKGLTD